MFYLASVEDYIRVEPRHFGLPTREAVEKQLKESYVNSISKDLGMVLCVVDVSDVGDGIIIPGDGATFYRSEFKVVVWKPVLHELVYGAIEEITNFGAFINLGPVKGMIHISQTMEDYVTLSKTGTLSGQASKRSISVGDECVARVVAISYKMGEPKIGLTMRQPGLGKLEWIEDAKKRVEKARKIAESGEKGRKKAKKGGRSR